MPPRSRHALAVASIPEAPAPRGRATVWFIGHGNALAGRVHQALQSAFDVEFVEVTSLVRGTRQASRGRPAPSRPRSDARPVLCIVDGMTSARSPRADLRTHVGAIRAARRQWDKVPILVIVELRTSPEASEAVAAGANVVVENAEVLFPATLRARIRSILRHREAAVRSAMSDVELVNAMRADDPWAWAEFQTRFRPVLMGFARHSRVPTDAPTTATEALVDDVLADEAMRLVQPQTESVQNVAAYLVRAARQRLLVLRRESTRRQQRYQRALAAHGRSDLSVAVGSHEDGEPGPTVVAALFSQHARRAAWGGGFVEAPHASPALSAALHSLASDADRLLLAWLADGVSHRVIAAWLGITPDAATRRIARLQSRVRRSLAVLADTQPEDLRAELSRFISRTTVGPTARDASRSAQPVSARPPEGTSRPVTSAPTPDAQAPEFADRAAGRLTEEERRAAAARTAAAVERLPDVASRAERAERAARASMAALLDHVSGALRDPDTGRLDALEVARRLGVSVRQLAGALGVSQQALSKTRTSRKAQPQLEPIVALLQVLSEAGLSEAESRMWLRAPNDRLGGLPPLELVLNGSAMEVVRVVEDALDGHSN